MKCLGQQSLAFLTDVPQLARFIVASSGITVACVDYSLATQLAEVCYAQNGKKSEVRIG
jgi:hypothetical protein